MRKTIDATVDLDWFNIGCAGHATAKLVLAGYTESAKEENNTSWEDPRNQDGAAFVSANPLL